MNSLKLKHQGKSSINCHFTCQLRRIYESFKEQYFRSIQSASWLFSLKLKKKLTVWKIQSLIPMIKIIWKGKWMTWLGCTKQCKKNWKQHHIQNKSKFLPWYLINGLKYTVQNILMSLNTLFEIPHWNQKSIGGILAKPVPKKGKTITNKTRHLITNVYEDDNFST